MLSHPPTLDCVGFFAVLHVRGTNPDKQIAATVRRLDSARWSSRIADGLAAAHLQGPRFIVHLLDHLLSPVRIL